MVRKRRRSRAARVQHRKHVALMGAFLLGGTLVCYRVHHALIDTAASFTEAAVVGVIGKYGERLVR